MIYCVVPRPLAGDLFDRLTEYYKDEPNVEVIVDRRGLGESSGNHPGLEDRRRQRPTGSFPPIDPPSGG